MSFYRDPRRRYRRGFGIRALRHVVRDAAFQKARKAKAVRP